jgi:hypothetical protein
VKGRVPSAITALHSSMPAKEPTMKPVSFTGSARARATMPSISGIAKTISTSTAQPSILLALWRTPSGFSQARIAIAPASAISTIAANRRLSAAAPILRSKPSSQSASGGMVSGTAKLVISETSSASDTSSRRNAAVVAADTTVGAMALRQSAATSPGQTSSILQSGQTASGTAIRIAADNASASHGRASSARTRGQSVRTSASISRRVASGPTSGRAAAARSWNRMPTSSEKGSNVVACRPIRRRT